MVKSMSVVKDTDRNIDVICQICTDASIIPMKMRITDETGETQQFKVKEYREIPYRPNYQMSNGVVVHKEKSYREFECKIEIFGREKRILIIYNVEKQIWMYSKGSFR